MREFLQYLISDVGKYGNNTMIYHFSRYLWELNRDNLLKSMTFNEFYLAELMLYEENDRYFKAMFNSKDFKKFLKTGET